MSNPADSTLKMEINGKKFHTKNFREAQDFIIAELEKKNWKQFDVDLDEAFKAGDVVYVKPSMFTMFFPQDGHAPAVTSVPLKKIIVKIAVK